MNIFRSTVLSLVVLFMMTGCGGGGSSDSNITILSLSLPVSESTIEENSKNTEIKVYVYDANNTPYQTGNVKVIYPDDIKTGRDIGHFASSSVSVSNGIASFSYVGPSDILVDNSDIIFKFYHEDNPTIIKNYTMKIDTSKVIITDYELQVDYGNDINMNLESTKQINIAIKDSNGAVIDDSYINSIKITLKNPSLGTLEDMLGNIGDSSTINNKNNILVNVKSNTISGLMPLEVTVKVDDGNGNLKTLSKTFNLLILSGPPTAMSLSYVSSSQSANIAKFTEKWVLTVTDRYNNLVNTEPSVSAGLIAGFARSSAATPTNNQNYLYYESGGTLYANDTFVVTSGPFSNMDLSNDKFVTFGNGYTYNASGKFEISSNTASTLTLLNDYEGNTTTNLGFAVGNNYRQDSCKFGQEWVANVIYRDGQVVNKDTGTLVLDIEYDYYLVGKSVVLYVNLLGNHNTNPGVKIGEARKLTLRANGIEGIPIAYSIGATGVYRVNIMISSTQISEGYYLNANFGGYNVAAADDLSWSIVGSSMDDNNVSSCVNSGVAYVDINITSPAPSAGVISLEKVFITDEF